MKVISRLYELSHENDTKYQHLLLPYFISYYQGLVKQLVKTLCYYIAIQKKVLPVVVNIYSE